MTNASSKLDIVFGVLGNYYVNADPSDECYGLYLSLSGRAVLVDIREDKYLEQRKAHALGLFANCRELERSLESFVRANPAFASRSLSSIGLHSKVLTQGEVFWEPEGYTLLRGLSFDLE
jgi:hypothetical protein